MERKIAKIRSTMLGTEGGHGFLTCYLDLDYGGSGQAAGGYGFDTPMKDNDGKVVGRRGVWFGMEFIRRVLKACGVQKWEDLPGRTVYALFADSSWGGKVIGLAPLPTEPGEEFIFEELAEEYHREESKVVVE